MARFFSTQTAHLSPRGKLEAQLKTANANLLAVVVFSLINVVLTVANTGSYFLFSAFFPFEMVILGMDLCGKFPPEYYEGGMDFEPLPDAVLYVLTALAVVATLLYLVCWFLTKKHSGGWLIAALVMFGFDTLFMLAMCGIDATMILDYVFHAWVLVYLILGVRAWAKLRHMPPEEAEAAAASFVGTAAPTASPFEAPKAADPTEPVAAATPEAAEPTEPVAAATPDATEPEAPAAADAAVPTADALDADSAFRKIGTSDDTDSAAN